MNVSLLHSSTDKMAVASPNFLGLKDFFEEHDAFLRDDVDADFFPPSVFLSPFSSLFLPQSPLSQKKFFPPVVSSSSSHSHVAGMKNRGIFPSSPFSLFGVTARASRVFPSFLGPSFLPFPPKESCTGRFV